MPAHHLCLRQLALTGLTPGRLLGPWDRFCISLGCQGEEPVDLRLQLALKRQEALVAHRTVLRGRGMEFLDADVAQFEQAHRLSNQQNLHKKVFEFTQKTLAERSNRVMVSVQITRNEAERDRVLGGRFREE